ncbi:hypothetical protein PBY51_024658 [Eleginops maclovinus]|uniref:Uncharacterized protein n=1 Tax=Eleginops maclovinus TaxID=56733 RepID=A0AAN7Y1S7_ELEMC|nr:hypothetical protein PBY51_024658 [Eleginops maclovinus]
MTTDSSPAASSALPPLPLPPPPFPFFSPTHLSPRSGRLVFSGKVELGLGCLPAPIRSTNQAEVSTRRHGLPNCTPVLCPHTLLLWALPHATTLQAWHQILS